MSEIFPEKADPIKSSLPMTRKIGFKFAGCCPVPAKPKKNLSVEKKFEQSNELLQRFNQRFVIGRRKLLKPIYINHTQPTHHCDYRFLHLWLIELTHWLRISTNKANSERKQMKENALVVPVSSIIYLYFLYEIIVSFSLCIFENEETSRNRIFVATSTWTDSPSGTRGVRWKTILRQLQWEMCHWPIYCYSVCPCNSLVFHFILQKNSDNLVHSKFRCWNEIN